MNLIIRPYEEEYFNQIEALNKAEEWYNLVVHSGLTKRAWENSTVAYVALDNDVLIGYVRGLTDANITLYVCELLIHAEYRNQSIGSKLLNYVHNKYPTTRMELLASSSSYTYYEQKNSDPFMDIEKHLMNKGARNKG